jgi:2-iminobutanoate/2-iminopropanoate deaminase
MQDHTQRDVAQLAHYSNAIETRELVFLSGQLALDQAGSIVGTDIRTQTERTLENLGRVLTAQGLHKQDVVKATIWIRHESDFIGFNEVYAAFFGAHKPARSTVVCGLVLAQALIEIEAVAQRRR